MQTVRVDLISWDDPRAEAARRIRMAVFVEEQGVPAEMELDEKDAGAVHAVAMDGAGVVCATGRLVDEEGDGRTARIGRMAVLREARGRGAGRRILQALIAEARRRAYLEIVLSSQVQAIGFYERMGFVCEGEAYDDAGIAHRTMRKRLGDGR